MPRGKPLRILRSPRRVSLRPRAGVDVLRPALKSSVKLLRGRRFLLDRWSMWDTVPAFHVLSTQPDQAHSGRIRSTRHPKRPAPADPDGLAASSGLTVIADTNIRGPGA